jgi:hypothetical protein
MRCRCRQWLGVLAVGAAPRCASVDAIDVDEEARGSPTTTPFATV